MKDDFLPEDFEKQISGSLRRLKIKWFLIGATASFLFRFLLNWLL